MARFTVERGNGVGPTGRWKRLVITDSDYVCNDRLEYLLSEREVAALVLFLQTCGETWKVSQPASPAMASR